MSIITDISGIPVGQVQLLSSLSQNSSQYDSCYHIEKIYIYLNRQYILNKNGGSNMDYDIFVRN